MRVLIVDDELSVRQALIELIQAEPSFEVVAAVGTAEEAAAAAVLAPDIAVVDVRLPGGGPEAVRAILAASPATYVLACSSFSDRVTRRTMADAGARDYVVKGIDDVVAAVRRGAGLDVDPGSAGLQL